MTVCGSKVTLFNDDQFSLIRKQHGIPDDFLDSGWNYAQMKKGSGKGGDLMVILSDFVIKELSQGDHKELLDIAAKLVSHWRNKPSLITPIFLHWTYEDRYYYAQARMTPQGPYKVLFDLKGCDDDKLLEKNGKKIVVVNKRWFNLCMWCGTCNWSQDRMTYYEGKLLARAVKFAVTEEQRRELLMKMRYDIEFLKAEGLMDYSLLVAQKEGSSEKDSCSYRHAMVSSDGTQEVTTYISIIDYLQRWNFSKVVANAIKVLERNKATIKPAPYGDRFCSHFEKVFSAKA